MFTYYGKRSQSILTPANASLLHVSEIIICQMHKNSDLQSVFVYEMNCGTTIAIQRIQKEASEMDGREGNL